MQNCDRIMCCISDDSISGFLFQYDMYMIFPYRNPDMESSLIQHKKLLSMNKVGLKFTQQTTVFE